MAEKSENLPTECALFKERIVKISEANEFLAVGIDPVSFVPVIRICKTDGDKTAYVTSPVETFWVFRRSLRSKLDDEGYSFDCSITSELYVESVTDDSVQIESNSGEKVCISNEAAEQLTYGCPEIDKIESEYFDAFRSALNTIISHQRKSYRRHFVENLNEAKKCDKLCEYLGIEKII